MVEALLRSSRMGEIGPSSTSFGPGGRAMSALRLTRFSAVAALALGVLLVIAGPASAQPGYGAGGITVSLSASASDDSITATGSGFGSGETVTGTVFSNPVDLGTKNADSSCEVSFTFSVQNLSPGEHTVVLSGPSGSGSATFTVTESRQGGGTAPPENGPSTGGGESGASAAGSLVRILAGVLASIGSNAIMPLSVIGLLLIVGGCAALVSSRHSRSKNPTALPVSPSPGG